MLSLPKLCTCVLALIFLFSCTSGEQNEMVVKDLVAAEILGKPDYLAISYGGYRARSRDEQPTMTQLQEDMLILSAMNIRILRTYNVGLPQAANILAAIRALKEADPAFEMYVMLGAWIDCKNAWTDSEPDHDTESEKNAAEIERAVALAQKYPDIVKVIAVGNEAMVKWAASYYVQPGIILKWVNHLQGLKAAGELPEDLWITSSDNFASWGGGGEEYHVEDLNKLIRAVDFISLHTYPMHDTHYNPEFWGARASAAGQEQDKEALVEAAMLRAKAYAISQYDSVASYVKTLGVDKPLHIGETGWATSSNGFYGEGGSRATDEYKMGLYYQHMRDWTGEAKMACFYFEAFDEPWKDGTNPGGSENHFGLFTVKGEAKYPLWPLVDAGVFDGLTRDGHPITKTFDGDKAALMETVLPPPLTVVEEQ
ncbi:glycosyl hydrolase family 17 [Neolewinella agarilytica]|uniref:glycosyl hydrolase family 17 n=1 Tax=Neolewinella agarilytica TaxID=478744 RepID=UPI0023574974|nr:glycosyl hydrolase family 17 [Neolewinella agarilytica]